VESDDRVPLAIRYPPEHISRITFISSTDQNKSRKMKEILLKTGFKYLLISILSVIRPGKCGQASRFIDPAHPNKGFSGIRTDL